MNLIKEYLQKPLAKRLLILVLIGLYLYLTKSLISLYLLTFIFAYLINTAQKFIYRHIHKYIPVNRSFIIGFIYAAVIALIVALIWVYAPKVIRESIAVISTITSSVKALLNTTDTGNDFLNTLLVQVKNIDISKYAENSGKLIFSFISSLGSFSLFIFMSLILSMFFMFEKSRIISFIGKFKTSKISWLYSDLRYFGLKFTNSFGKVLQTQILISFINSALSIIALWIMGFPNVLGLGFMIFILGMIPVAGVFISLIPLSLIAYSIGGLRTILYVLIMIIVLHSLEAYVLNPKLMSDKTKLPIFFTFLILFISEHFFGIWGLLVGIPVFIFLLDILEVDLTGTSKKLPLKLKSKLKHDDINSGENIH